MFDPALELSTKAECALSLPQLLRCLEAKILTDGSAESSSNVPGRTVCVSSPSQLVQTCCPESRRYSGAYENGRIA